MRPFRGQSWDEQDSTLCLPIHLHKAGSRSLKDTLFRHVGRDGAPRQVSRTEGDMHVSIGQCQVRGGERAAQVEESWEDSWEQSPRRKGGP